MLFPILLLLMLTRRCSGLTDRVAVFALEMDVAVAAAVAVEVTGVCEYNNDEITVKDKVIIKLRE